MKEEIVTAVALVITGGAFIAVVIWAVNLYHESDAGLLGDNTCIRIISEDVLGNPLYGMSCSRSLYAENVEVLPGGDKESGVFKFHPIPGKEVQCPPISIIVDRKTGEAWIAQ